MFSIRKTGKQQQQQQHVGTRTQAKPLCPPQYTKIELVIYQDQYTKI